MRRKVVLGRRSDGDDGKVAWARGEGEGVGWECVMLEVSTDVMSGSYSTLVFD